MILITCADAFANMLTFHRTPTLTVNMLMEPTENPIIILLMITFVRAIPMTLPNLIW